MLRNKIKGIRNRIRHTAKRAALSTLELMILIVVVAAVVGGAASILTSKMFTMSDHVDETLTQVTQDIVTQGE